MKNPVIPYVKWGNIRLRPLHILGPFDLAMSVETRIGLERDELEHKILYNYYCYMYRVCLVLFALFFISHIRSKIHIKCEISFVLQGNVCKYNGILIVL